MYESASYAGITWFPCHECISSSALTGVPTGHAASEAPPLSPQYIEMLKGNLALSFFAANVPAYKFHFSGNLIFDILCHVTIHVTNNK